MSKRWIITPIEKINAPLPSQHGTAASTPLQALMEQAYSENEAYWYSIDAIKNGDVIYLPVEFCSTAGIHVVDSINTLIDCIEAFYAEK